MGNKKHFSQLNYNGKVLILKSDSRNGECIKFKIGSSENKTVMMKGLIIYQFESESWWFKKNYWVNFMPWFLDLGRLCFINANDDPLSVLKDSTKLSRYKRESIHIFDFLKTIILEVNSLTGKSFTMSEKKTRTWLNFDDYWTESYIPLKMDSLKYILTWENSNI